MPVLFNCDSVNGTEVNDGVMRQSGRGNQQVGAAMSEPRRKPPPDSRLFRSEGQEPVPEQAHRPVDPGAQLRGELRLPPGLERDPAFDFAERDDAQIEIFLRLRAEPGRDRDGALRPARRGERVGVEEKLQNFTGRAAALARSIVPGKARR